MAVVTVKSATITKKDADAADLIGSKAWGGYVQEWQDFVEVTNGDSSTSKFFLFEIHSSTRVSGVYITHPDIGTTGTCDIGLYEVDGTVVDADFFASAYSLKDGAKDEQVVTHESAVIGLEECNEPIWELLGLSSDPNKFYRVALTLTADSDATGKVKLRIQGVTR